MEGMMVQETPLTIATKMIKDLGIILVSMQNTSIREEDF